MTDIFADLQKQAKESRERWAEINQLSADLKAVTEAPFAKETEVKIIKLLLLMVEQMRPLQDTSEQSEKLQSEIEDMLGSISKMMRKK